jgi:hypothetical protein
MPSLRATMLVVLLVVGGCGGNGESSAEHQVRTTVDAWLAALRSGDDVRACSSLTPGLRRSIDTQLRMRGEKQSCRTFAAKWTGGSTPPGRPGAHVTTVHVTKAKASADLAAPPDRSSVVHLLRRGDHWLIENY